MPNDIRTWLADKGYDPKFGARPLNRLITHQIGNKLAEKIIRGQVKMNDTAVVKVMEDGSGLEVVAKASEEMQ